MKRENRDWIRRAQLLFALSLLFIYLIFVGDPEFLARVGIMRQETSWSRWVAVSRGIFVIGCAIAVIGSWSYNFYPKQAFAFVAVSSTANLVTDFPIIYQLGMDDPTILFMLIFVARLGLSLVAISLYFDFDNAPRERALSKSLFALRLPKSE